MKNIIKLTVVLFIATLLFSCKKDWLSPAQENQLIAEDSTFLDPDNAIKFVNAAYNQLLTWETHSFAFLGVTSIISDDADKGSSPGDNGTDKDVLDAGTYSSTTASFNGWWLGLYRGINNCNQAIVNVPLYNIDESLKSRLIGEARFLRAFFYFYLVRGWGDVPLVDTIINPNNPADFNKGNVRVAKENIYALIESDLNYALNVLPTKAQYSASDLGRATKGAAAAMLAKVSMYQKKWDAALTLTNNIINGTYGTYGLVADYSTIWREIGENSIESLFEVQSKGTLPAAGIQQYSETQGIRGGTYAGVTTVMGGWGFNTPSADLDAAYEAGDVRRKATIIHVGDTLFDGVILVSAVNERYNYKAYVSRTTESYSGSSVTNKNLRILRMGEIYLINAEAANELNNTSLAISSLNAVRNRAKLANTTASTQSALREAIWKERRVELGMEHDRFFDLVRQGRAGTVLRAHGKTFVDGKNELFPIPENQISASDNSLTQNPGY